MLYHSPLCKFSVDLIGSLFLAKREGEFSTGLCASVVAAHSDLSGELTRRPYTDFSLTPGTMFQKEQRLSSFPRAHCHQDDQHHTPYSKQSVAHSVGNGVTEGGYLAIGEIAHQAQGCRGGASA